MQISIVAFWSLVLWPAYSKLRALNHLRKPAFAELYGPYVWFPNKSVSYRSLPGVHHEKSRSQGEFCSSEYLPFSYQLVSGGLKDVARSTNKVLYTWQKQLWAPGREIEMNDRIALADQTPMNGCSQNSEMIEDPNQRFTALLLSKVILVFPEWLQSIYLCITDY